jgi:N-methylhydantoinase B
MDAMLERNKRAMRELIRRTVPEKKQYFEDYICDDGLDMGPYKIACSMWREGDKCIFDFTGTDPQSISSINFLLNEEMFKMFAGVYMIMVFDPQILFNDGFYDLMEVRIPEGTLLKPLKPAALSCRTHALGRIFDVLGGLLGQGNPGIHVRRRLLRQPPLHVLGLRQERRVVPALPDHLRRHPRQAVRRRPGRPLAVALVHQRAERVPRSYFPLRIDIYETIPDTGGAGKNRGGNGLRIGLPLPRARRDLDPRRPLAHVSLGRERRPAGCPQQEDAGARRRHRDDLLPSKIDRIKVEAGDLLIADTWGGGGCGDPYEREIERVVFDVQAGLVTPKGALNYGVVIRGEDLTADVAATESLRARLKAERGTVKLFDRGFESVDELKSRCEDETGLPPPRQPTFSQRVLAARKRSRAKLA